MAFVVAFPRCLVSSLDSIARLGSCQCFATVGTLQWFHPVIQSQSGAYLYIFSDPPAICFPSKWASAYQRFDLWDWLCQGWSMNFSSLKYFQAVCLCHQTNFQIEHTFKSCMPAGGRTRVGKSMLHKPERHIQTNLDVLARWIRAITLAKGRHFWLHRFKNQRKGRRKRSRKEKTEGRYPELLKGLKWYV